MKAKGRNANFQNAGGTCTIVLLWKTWFNSMGLSVFISGLGLITFNP